MRMFEDSEEDASGSDAEEVGEEGDGSSGLDEDSDDASLGVPSSAGKRRKKSAALSELDAIFSGRGCGGEASEERASSGALASGPTPRLRAAPPPTRGSGLKGDPLATARRPEGRSKGLKAVASSEASAEPTAADVRKAFLDMRREVHKIGTCWGDGGGVWWCGLALERSGARASMRDGVPTLGW